MTRHSTEVTQSIKLGCILPGKITFTFGSKKRKKPGITFLPSFYRVTRLHRGVTKGSKDKHFYPASK
jgi:hypothetical protein